MLSYVSGDATALLAGDPSNGKCLAHITNNAGQWGAGFVLAISRRWAQPEKSYRISRAELGFIQLVRVGEKRLVANMCAQDNVTTRIFPRVQYEALNTCLQNLAFDLDKNYEIHMPRIGCGLGGGVWEKIEPLIEENLEKFSVFVYDY